MSVIIKFYKGSTAASANPDISLDCVKAELFVGNAPADNIAVLWAKKGMLLLQEMMDNSSISFIDHIECPVINIGFYPHSLPDFDCEDGATETPSDEAKSTIEFRLSVVGEETIGWQMTPTFYLANTLFQTIRSVAESVSLPASYLDDDESYDDNPDEDCDYFE